jgi:predicted Mrr-cat superfamily restriction endonuclease
MHDVAIGDLVVLPLMSRPAHVAVGRVQGDYKYRADREFAGSDAKHTRSVDWLATELGYERFDPDLREAFDQQGPLAAIREPSAAQRIIDVVEH